MNDCNRTSQNTLDLSVVVDGYLARIMMSCKTSVAHTAKQQIMRMKHTRDSIEKELLSIKQSGGIFQWLKRQKQVANLKRKLLAIDEKIVQWINSFYKYFLS